MVGPPNQAKFQKVMGPLTGSNQDARWTGHGCTRLIVVAQSSFMAWRFFLGLPWHTISQKTSIMKPVAKLPYDLTDEEIRRVQTEGNHLCGYYVWDFLHRFIEDAPFDDDYTTHKDAEELKLE